MATPTHLRASTEEEAVIAALGLPLVVDIYGSLFALRDDGATISVPKPTASKSVGFFPAQNDIAERKYIASNRRIYCSLGGARSYVIDDERVAPSFFGFLPDYNPIFRLRGQQTISRVVSNSGHGLACITMTNDAVNVVIPQVDMYALGGWCDDDAMTLVGMRRRVHRERGKNFVHRWGAAMTVSMTVDSGRVIRNSDDRKLASGIESKLPMEYRITGDEKFEIECWLGSFGTFEGERGLIGGIRDYSVFDDGWAETEKPSRSDFVLTGLYQIQNGMPALQRVFFPYGYVQVLPAPEGDFIYLLRWQGRGDATVADLHVLKCSHGEAVAAEAVQASISGIDAGAPLSYFAAMHDERVGYYGCIGVREELLIHKSYLIRSLDGVQWVVVHPLAPTIGTVG